MLLRKFEAYGFKSFADKTEIEFGKGITAIVGPNGSGKSNIADAIRWVLGEQNIRNLRGLKTEDIIFTGSDKRRQLGLAEVSLIFDNSDGVLPLDYSEITITRRIFRSGDSEYFINKSACRLKDIYDLLADARIGRDSMTIIGQNKIDEVLNSKPEERRLLFEEAAGISKYKLRKKEALRKLEDTEHNLIRVADISAEIESQLEPLAESARRTARYNELNAELTALQVTLILKKLDKAQKMVDSSKLEIAALTDQDIATNTRLSMAEAEKEKLNTMFESIDKSLAEFDDLIRRANIEIERADAKIAVLNERIAQGIRSEERIRQEKELIVRQQSEAATKLAALRSELNLKNKLKADFNEELKHISDEHAAALTTLASLEKQIEDGKDKTFDYMHELVNNRNMLRMIEKDLTAAQSRRTHGENEKLEYNNQLKQLEARIATMAAERQKLSNELITWKDEHTSLLQDKQRMEKSLADHIHSEKQLNNRLNELEARLKMLSAMQSEYEGFGRGSKEILKNREFWQSGVCGAVAQLIAVSEKYVTAVEIALGGSVQHIVVENDHVAREAIHFLNVNKLGRVTFLPLNTVKPLSPRDFERAAAYAEGALGFASELVSFDAKYHSIVEYLLGRTVVSQNLEAALRIAKQHSFSLKIVTLDGELINPGGAIAGGSIGKRDTSFFSRSNDINRVKNQINRLEQEIASIQGKNVKLKDNIQLLTSNLTGLQEKIQAAEVRQAELSVRFEQTTANIERLKLAINTVDEELFTFNSEYQELQANYLATKQKIAALEDLDNEHKTQVVDLQQQYRLMQAKKETLIADITDLKIRFTAINQETVNIEDNVCGVETLLVQLKERLQQLESEQNHNLGEMEENRREIRLLEEVRAKLLADIANYKGQHSELMTQKVAGLSEIHKNEKDIKELRRRLNDIQARLHEMQLIHTKYTYETEYCIGQLKEQYSLELDQAYQYFRDANHEFLTANVLKIEDDIKALGPVNPAAIEEFAKLQERHQFLQEQYKDLVNAKNCLASVIKEIDQTMSRQFKAAFETIEKYFGNIFVRLFGGGRAQILLTEPDNPLDGGIEIFVQPPGKKQQNLALLSGGERALTVIALLFSFLQYRPTSFCVVDEIDAALDEANVQRFGEFLREYAKDTQFILITHRKGTMEVADTMHGVTMEESGVSKLISVKFMDKAG